MPTHSPTPMLQSSISMFSSEADRTGWTDQIHTPKLESAGASSTVQRSRENVPLLGDDKTQGKYGSSRLPLGTQTLPGFYLDSLTVFDR